MRKQLLQQAIDHVLPAKGKNISCGRRVSRKVIIKSARHERGIALKTLKEALYITVIIFIFNFIMELAFNFNGVLAKLKEEWGSELVFYTFYLVSLFLLIFTLLSISKWISNMRNTRKN